MASSHAFTLMDPSTWDTFRLQNRQSYERRYGTLPAEHVAEIAVETDETVRARYERIEGALAQLRSTLARQRPDAIIIIADDQDENFTDTIPQFGVYLGADFRTDRLKGGRGFPVIPCWRMRSSNRAYAPTST